MPKRSTKDKIEQYERKIRKLREKERPWRRLVIMSSSEDESSGIDTATEVSATKLTDAAVPQDVTSAETPATPAAQDPDTQTEPELDPELLSALGDATDEVPNFGENIHPNLAQRWLPLLKKGLPKETKDKLIKDYLVPQNCPLLQAPKLNAEISAAVSESVRIRDKKIETAQQQLGSGISAVNKAMTLLLTSDNKVEAIRHLSDGCRILSDLHYVETQARIKLLTPGLSKQFLTVIQDNARDETLFGIKLTEKIKASKVIEKQGLQIKKPVTTQKPMNVSSQPSTSRAQYQGNWTGPSRYSTSRGGRLSGTTRKPTTIRKTAPTPAPATRPAGQGRPRVAPTQQPQ